MADLQGQFTGQVTFTPEEIATFPQGPKGDKGDKGDQGDPGPKGDPGLPGSGAGFGLNVKDFGAKGDGVANDTAAIQAAIDQAALGFGSSVVKGGRVLVPKGLYMVSDTIRVKNYVRLIGDNDGAVKIKASSSFPTDGRAVVQVGPGDAPSNDAYAATLENIRIECSNRTNVVGIKLDDVNEKGGLRNVEVRQCVADTAIDIVNGAHLFIEKVGVLGKTVCIRCRSLSGPVWFRDISLSTSAGGVGTAGIRVENGTIQVQNIHVESVENGVDFVGGYGGVVTGARGHGSVTAVVNIAPAMAQRPFYAQIMSAGALYSVRDALFHRAYKGDVVLMEAPVAPPFDVI